MSTDSTETLLAVGGAVTLDVTKKLADALYTLRASGQHAEVIAHQYQTIAATFLELSSAINESRQQDAVERCREIIDNMNEIIELLRRLGLDMGKVHLQVGEAINGLATTIEQNFKYTAILATLPRF